jgi:glucokinase
MKNFAIGTDIGGSHISCALIDMEDGSVQKESLSEVPVNNKASEDIILNSWTTALKKTISFISKNQLSGIGFAMPGPFDYEKGIALFERVDKYEGLYNVNIAKQIKSLMGFSDGLPVRFMNDATAFAVGESWIGKAARHKKSIAITLGTGFGSAFIESGLPVLERDDVPKLGCVWHLPYKDGIADDYFSTRWYIKSYAAKTGKSLQGVREIADRALKGDSDAISLFNEFGNNLGEFLATWIKSFDAEVIVIGGNMTGAYNLFGPSLHSALEKQKINIETHLSELKEDAAIIGSARLLDNSFWEKIKPLLSKM